ncbi:hypothetical protein RP726_01870 [Candidatus Methylospira mobilis]|uniref:hypothetical protein n=1 Tax=Candidatus Methylospira mobilis TaxID=1808979 RepID=UPI001D172D5A|nr:hypothetical protein [Candidatus Methylospira mobilis]WNV05169.1 hypothetical protein RP726_01870 [Candidatus Methylospira mobilis]
MAFELYRMAARLLTGYRFIFASDRGGTPGFAVNRTFSAGAAVRSLFNTERVLVLDTETAEEMESGHSTYPIDYSISLDTNAMSYLRPYMAGKRLAPLPKDFQAVFEFIARPEVNIDPIPYFSENLPTLVNGETVDKIFENLKAYEILRNLDGEWLKKKGEVRSTLTEQELVYRAQQLLSRMYMDIGNAPLLKEILFRHQYMYACLIKMAAIQIKSPSAGLGRKMEAFLDFSHSRLATMNGRETAIARAYFQRGQKLKFFGKIQKGRSDILELLSNMAWDIWHVRQIEQSLAFMPSKGARYFFPALLTFDHKLIEVMDLYPLKACAFKIGESKPMPIFNGNTFELMVIDDDNHVSAIKRYFSEDAIAIRDSVRESVMTSFSDLVKSLEEELIAIVGGCK